MELVLGSCVLIGLALLILKSSLDRALELSSEVGEFRTQSKIKRSAWKNTSGKVLRLGINVDFPEVLFKWPVAEDFDSDERFEKAIVDANHEVEDTFRQKSIFGNVLIEYSYTDDDGNAYTSRTIGRLPSPKRDKEMALGLRIGDRKRHV